jgi:hypothetical protein
MSDSLSFLKRKIDDYIRMYRKESLKSLELSDLYDLFPEKKIMQPEITPVAIWPDNYPFATNKGVYVILDDFLNVLYIGKASMNVNIGTRLGKHFCYDDDKKHCKTVEVNWSVQPRYVIIISCHDSLAFEAPALEEYLLGTVDTSDNTIKPNKGSFS